MFGMGMGEIILIAVVALLVLGPDRLPGAAKALGKGIRDLRSQTKDLKETIEKDTELGDAVRELRGALRGDPETLYERVTGQRFTEPSSSKSKLPEGATEGDGNAEGEGDGDGEANGQALADSATESSDEHTPGIGLHPGPVPDLPDQVDAPIDASDSFEPVIRSAEGAVARSGGDVSGSDDPGHG